ncbi:MAG TPA: alpha,alpha-trehalase TreF [Rhizomicrobium sp.]|jgi:alpha,alpha-trehalase|nr:alpha,alpha-trehalase TreF [Rhizomicrobium sp.]
MAPQSPAELFGALFADVQRARIFADGKTFADARPRRTPEAILADYAPPLSSDDLRAFVLANFELPADVETPAFTKVPLREHIARLWPHLVRPPVEASGSLLSLKHPSIVPGGRFREVYYWDSYFTLLGAAADGHDALVRDMVDNFADLIERYGHVPNGTRTYYLGRSQPPVFYLMAGLLHAGDRARTLPVLLREYAFWMEGHRAVTLPDGTVLNRYWDDRDTPRDESWLEDVELARGNRALYRDLRAAAESGWDFSARWMADRTALGSIETTNILPVDLNCLLFGLEQAIAHGGSGLFEEKAMRRREAIDRYLWDDASGTYLDFHWRRGQRLDRPSAAMLFPLFVGAASLEQARGVAAFVERHLLAPGGLRTTTVRSGQQWDAPNGWAPLQWIAVRGLKRYGEHALADAIATRWLATVSRTYRETGKLVEKYDVEEARAGGGGEYPVQDGFGWTNGVTRALLAEYPHV